MPVNSPLVWGGQHVDRTPPRQAWTRWPNSGSLGAAASSCTPDPTCPGSAPWVCVHAPATSPHLLQDVLHGVRAAAAAAAAAAGAGPGLAPAWPHGAPWCPAVALHHCSPILSSGEAPPAPACRELKGTWGLAASLRASELWGESPAGDGLGSFSSVSGLGCRFQGRAAQVAWIG